MDCAGSQPSLREGMVPCLIWVCDCRMAPGGESRGGKKGAGNRMERGVRAGDGRKWGGDGEPGKFPDGEITGLISQNGVSRELGARQANTTCRRLSPRRASNRSAFWYAGSCRGRAMQQVLRSDCYHKLIMTMPGARRHNLFVRLAERLSCVDRESCDAVKCPLCLEAFGPNSIASGDLTVEHIIPHRLGGRTVTLTCKRCNNLHGSTLDSHLVQMVRMLDALDGTGKIPVQIQTTAGLVAANVAWRSGQKGDPRTFRVVGKATSPASMDALRTGLRAANDLTITMDFKFIRGQAYQALYRIAYLSVFADRGYEYALSQGAAFARCALGPKGYEVSIPILEASVSTELRRPVLAISLSEPVSAYVIVIRVKAHTVRHYAVVLPGPETAEPGNTLNEIAAALRGCCLRAAVPNETALSVRFTSEAFSNLSAE